MTNPRHICNHISDQRSRHPTWRAEGGRELHQSRLTTQLLTQEVRIDRALLRPRRALHLSARRAIPDPVCARQRKDEQDWSEAFHDR